MSIDQELCKLLFETAGSAILVLRHEQIITSNQSAVDLFGSKKDDLSGKKLTQLSPPTQPNGQSSEQLLQQKIEASRVAPQHFEWAFKWDNKELRTQVALNAITSGPETYLQLIIHPVQAGAQFEESSSDAVAELKAQRDFLRKVIDTNPHFIFAKDREGRFVLANEAFAKAYGAPVEELVGKSDADFNPNPDMVKRYRQVDMGVIESGQELVIEEEITNVSGEKLWRKTVKRPIYDDQGTVQQVLGIAIDINDLKRTEEALLKSEDQLQTLLERQRRHVRLSTLVAQDTTAVTNLNDLYNRVVTQIKEQFGFYHVQLLRFDSQSQTLALVSGYGDAGKQMLADGYRVSVGDGVIGGAAEQGVSILRANIAEDPHWQSHPLLPDTKGEIAVPIKFGQGGAATILGVLNVHDDVAGRLDDEDQLALEGVCGQIAVAIENTRLLESTNIFKQFAEASGQGMGFATIGGNMVYVNPTFAQILGKSNADDIVGSSMFAYYPDEVLTRLRNEIVPAVMRNGSWSGELPLISVQGKIIPTIQNFSLISNENNVPRYIANVVTNISERKRAELELESRLQELSALQRLMTREGWQSFSMSHGGAPRGYLFDQIDIQPLTQSDLENGQSDSKLDQQAPNNGHTLKQPVQLGEEVIGQLGIYDDPNQPLEQEDREFLSLMAEQVAEALERARLLEQINQRAVELEAVAQVSASVSTALEVDTLLQQVVDLTKSSFSLYHAHIYLLNQNEDVLNLAAGAGKVGQKMVAQGWRIALNQEHSLVSRAARTRQGFIVNDVRAEPDFLPNPLLPDTRSELAVPLIAGSRLLGVLDVQSDVVGRFSQEDLRIQTTLATQVAIALRNANLYGQANEALSETEALYDISAHISSASSLNEALLASIAPAIDGRAANAQLFTFDRKNDDQPEWLKIAATWDATDPNNTLSTGSRYHLPDFPFAKLWLNSSQNVIFIENIDEDDRLDASTRNAFKSNGLVASVFLLLQLSEQWVGLISINWTRPHKFTDIEQRLYKSVATQTAVVVNNLLLLEEANKRTVQLEKLAQIEAYLSQASEEEEFLMALSQAVQADSSATILLSYMDLDAGGRPAHLNPVARWQNNNVKWPVSSDKQISWLDITINDEPWFNTHDKILYLEDVSTHAELDDAFRGQLINVSIKSVVILPLYSGGRWQGVVIFHWPEIHRFSEDERFINSQLLEPVAAAVAGRRAYLAQEQTLDQTASLYIASRRISEAVDYNDIIAAVAEAGPVTVINRVLLYLFEYNAADQVIALEIAANWYSGYGQPPTSAGTRYLLSDFSHLKLFLNADPIFFNDVQRDDRLSPQTVELLQRSKIRVVAVLPLLVGVRQIGALVLEGEDAYHFSEHEIQPYLALTRQAAVAIENQRLLIQTNKALAEVEATQRRYTVQAWEEYQAKRKTLRYEQYREDKIFAQKVLNDETDQAVAQIELNADPEAQLDEPEKILEPKDVKSEKVVPLVVRGQIIGKLGFEELSHREWTPQEEAIIQSIALQLAQAAENLRLIDETQQRVARERRVNEIGDKIRGAQSLEEALQIAVKEVGVSLQAPETSVKLEVK